MAAFEDGILIHGAELRAVRDEIGSRTMPEVVRYYGHWKKYVLLPYFAPLFLNYSSSAKLREENKRALGDPTYTPRDEGKKRVAMTPSSDDEGSIDLRPSKANPSCGACRTRESKVWWKAPKGLTTNILCENCGINWRKYADLNVRPVREESLPSIKSKAIEKREGTPLTGPTTKRAKVSQAEVLLSR